MGYLDPPDIDVPPECDECDQVEECDHVMMKQCSKIIHPEPDYDVPVFDMTPFDPPEDVPTCQHGKQGDCNACDHLGDLAYDAAREGRYFR